MYPKRPVNVSLLFLLLLIAACGRDTQNYTAYFSGQIKNPRHPYVLFCKNGKVTDTLKLDKKNHFYIKFDSITPGMYSFKLEPDYQYVYLDQNDSISVALDAEDFDKSIVFSGKGAEKNNFMMELFTMTDNDRRNSYDSFSKDYSGFKQYADSTHRLRLAFYNTRKKELAWSTGFDFYAKNRVMLNYYGYSEYYPFLFARRTGEDIRPNLPENFYAYRKNIDFTDKRLIGFSPFLRYCMGLVNNTAYYKTFKHQALKENAIAFNINKLNVADSLFVNKDLKNTVLDNIAFAYLLEDQNMDNNTLFLNRYEQLSTSKDKNNEINRISAALKKLMPGEALPEIPLTNINNTPFNINTLKQKTVVFFWTGCARVILQQVYERVSFLKKQYPDVTFVAINIDNDAEWRKNLTTYNQKGVIQVRATDFDALRRKWALNKINRTIILNANGTIQNAFTNLLDESFEKELK